MYTDFRRSYNKVNLVLNNTIHEQINHEESFIKMLILVAALPHHKSGQGAQEDNPETTRAAQRIGMASSSSGLMWWPVTTSSPPAGCETSHLA